MQRRKPTRTKWSPSTATGWHGSLPDFEQRKRAKSWWGFSGGPDTWIFRPPREGLSVPDDAETENLKELCKLCLKHWCKAGYESPMDALEKPEPAWCPGICQAFAEAATRLRWS